MARDPRKRALYGGTYPARAKLVREAAYANPATRCWRCHKTLAEGIALYGRERAQWQAGHVSPVPGSVLRPEHAHCNWQEGRSRGGKTAMGVRDPRSPNA
jgi:hypothetical protein